MRGDLFTPLQDMAAQAQTSRIENLFAADAARFANFSWEMDGLLLDLSKTALTADILAALLDVAEKRAVPTAITAMFAGEAINTTENRAVLHTACRAGTDAPADVQETLARMRDFATALRDGSHSGHSGQRIRHVINIGIGGSHTGPQLVAQALSTATSDDLQVHFVSNIEGSDLARVLARVNIEETFFIIASKSFATPETMLNAAVARAAVLAHYQGDTKAIAHHFAALSTQKEKVAAFGIAPDKIFPFSDTVGGRFSAWSAIGLSVMVQIGVAAFDQWLAGAKAMDQHFRSAPLQENMPVLLALAGIWHRNACGYPALAVIPYHSGLARLPAWLQQLDMESNGKAVTKDGQPVSYATGPIVFGEPGTDSQHTFFQWLHQSPDIVPIEFIGVARKTGGSDDQHRMLTANLLAQSEALMRGHANPNEPHKNFTGNRPSITIMLRALTPYYLGQLMALYEHKIFVQGIIWGINSFDQFGVELGKVMAAALERDLLADKPAPHDGSTLGLINFFKQNQ